jgi:hypothetical protein
LFTLGLLDNRYGGGSSLFTSRYRQQEQSLQQSEPQQQPPPPPPPQPQQPQLPKFDLKSAKGRFYSSESRTLNTQYISRRDQCGWNDQEKDALVLLVKDPDFFWRYTRKREFDWSHVADYYDGRKSVDVCKRKYSEITEQEIKFWLSSVNRFAQVAAHLLNLICQQTLLDIYSGVQKPLGADLCSNRFQGDFRILI